jgi:acyl carrier protein
MEYGETEAVLKTLPHIEQAVVMPHGSVDRQLVAFIVLEPGAPVDSVELYQRLASRLAGSKVPDVYVALDFLPVTEEGELDRPALEEAVRGGQDASHRVPEILSGSAADVADIWREVLGLKAIGLRDNLFDLGGHSLTITRIAVRIRSRMGIDVPLTSFYDTPTVLGVSSAVERARRKAAHS